MDERVLNLIIQLATCASSLESRVRMVVSIIDRIKEVDDFNTNKAYQAGWDDHEIRVDKGLI